MLLLDEIEKGHPDIYNILLQVMDHGSLTDHNGKKIDFRNVVLIMTTNAGAADAAKQKRILKKLERQLEQMIKRVNNRRGGNPEQRRKLRNLLERQLSELRRTIRNQS
mgnify:CR=1 FL=1